MDLKTLDSLFNSTQKIKEQILLPGEYIFYQGDASCSIFAVIKGQICLERPTSEGRSVIMHTANSGDSFAEAALFSETYHCNAFATISTSIHTYPKQELLKILRAEPDKAEEYIALLSSQVRSLRSKLELRNILSAQERIMQYLSLIADPVSKEIKLTMTIKEYANELGLAHETLYRELAKLQTKGIIERTKEIIIIK